MVYGCKYYWKKQKKIELDLIDILLSVVSKYAASLLKRKKINSSKNEMYETKVVGNGLS